MLKHKSRLRRIQERVGGALAFIPLRPNHWTVLALLIATLGAFAVALEKDLVLGIFLFALGGALDMVDGAVARARNEATKFGGFLDGVSDRFMEALFLFAFMFYPLPEILIDSKIWLGSLVFLGTCMPSFIRSYAEYNGVITNEKAKEMGGFFERSERLLLVVAGLAAGILLSMEYFVGAVIIGVALSTITVLQRIGYVFYNRAE
jgi:archaetidylinositol phosphate synthase